MSRLEEVGASTVPFNVLLPRIRVLTLLKTSGRNYKFERGRLGDRE